MEKPELDDAVRLEWACKVLCGAATAEEAANELHLDHTTIARWVAIVRRSGGIALRATAADRYMTGEFYQLSRIVGRTGVFLHSLDRVISNQLPADEFGVSEVQGHIERLVDDIDTEQERELTPESGNGVLHFSFHGRYEDGKAIGMFWSCTAAHESRGTFILNRYNIAGHALAGSYSRLDFETDSAGNLVSVPSVPAQRHVVWTRCDAAETWQEYLARAKEEQPSFPAAMHVQQASALVVDLARAGAGRVRRVVARENHWSERRL